MKYHHLLSFNFIACCFLSVEAGMPGKTLLAMGDSLASGQTVGYVFFTENGWVNTVYDHLETNYGFDTLVNIACPAEETASFLDPNAGNETDCNRNNEPLSVCYSGVCDSVFTPQFPGSSQMDAAELYIQEHPGEVGLMVMSLGVNDVADCADAADPFTCISTGIALVTEKLNEIIARLQAAAPGVPIIGTQYFNPLAALYLPGGDLQGALAGEQFAPFFNSVVLSTFTEAGAYAADTFSAINGQDTSGSPRQDVINICAYTGMCADVDGVLTLTPDLDITDHQHPNLQGYIKMAQPYIQLIEENDLLPQPTADSSDMEVSPTSSPQMAPSIDDSAGSKHTAASVLVALGLIFQTALLL